MKRLRWFTPYERAVINHPFEMLRAGPDALESELRPPRNRREARKWWFTARELAELRLPFFPTTESGVLRYAKRNLWRESPLARRRSGRGGGWEYHISLLPFSTFKELERRRRRELGVVRHMLDRVLRWCWGER